MSGTLAGGQVRGEAPAGGETAGGLAGDRLAGDRRAGYRRATALRLLVRAARPRQWPKNVLVFAAPAAAGSLSRPAPVDHAATAALLFLLASAGTYLVNDVVDAPADRAHPTKRRRPVASGELAPRRALAAGAALAAAALVGAGLLSGPGLTDVIAAYLAISVAYTLVLKHVPLVELGCVASGFVLRAGAGGVADHLALSGWFLAVACAGALFVVAGKRSAELRQLGRTAMAHRLVLGRYRPGLLAALRLAAGLAAVVAYGLWAFSRAGQLDLHGVDLDDVAFKLSLLPFLLGVLATERAFEHGEGGAPEELALHRHDLQLLAGTCVVLVAIGVYA